MASRRWGDPMSEPSKQSSRRVISALEDPAVFEALLEDIAMRSVVDYERTRKDEAKRLRMRTSVLDAEIERRRHKNEIDLEVGENEGVPPEYSDEALALRFAEKHAPALRYVAAWRRWFFWDGQRWAVEETLKAFDLARAICRQAASECVKDPKIAHKVASAQTVAAVHRLAMADRRLAATVDQWDSDPWLLNTPNGVIDLRDGRCHPHRLDRFMTKIAAVASGGDCSQWMTFLDRVTAGDNDLVLYLQRLCGYALTGMTREQILAFLYGSGANGKTVFINTTSGIFGDYATSAPMETFTASKTERHPTELAMLRGARLVTATETEEGRRWAESKIKALTGGDKITARFMRQDFFTFTPQFTLIIAGNHKPGLRNVDEAIRRRLQLVPFTVTIPEGERDGELEEKLKAEWPGILQWMIEGTIEWAGGGGLQPPEAVLSATHDYLESEDAVAAWIRDCCVIDTGTYTRNAVLFASWQQWAKTAGEHPVKMTKFTKALDVRGFERYRTGKARGFIGIAVRRTEEDRDDNENG